MVKKILFITFSFVLFLSVFGQRCFNEKVCRQSRIHGMKSADCYNGEFKHFPKCLKSDVEIIDLSYNRLRKITKNDLKRYSDLKMLYLSDNLISKVDEDAFEGKDELHTLDISINGLTKLPPVVFHLPSLRSIYLSQNQNINIVETIENAKPITSPLIQLDISYNDLDTLPDLGIMPFLIKYNISGNEFTTISTKHIAGLCNLEILVNRNFTGFFKNPCDCWNIENWLKKRKVKFNPLECTINTGSCTTDIPKEDLDIYYKCKEIHQKIVLKSKLMKILIPVAVITVLLLTATVYLLIRRRKRTIKKLQNKSPPKQDGQMLL